MTAALIDGLMALATLAMIFVYSTQLAIVVLTAFVLYALLRLGLYQLFRERSQAVIQSKAVENSTLIETMRAIQTLKIFNRETERESQWLNRYADVVSSNVRLGRMKIAFTTINDVIFGLENIVTIYLAARLALNNSLSIGMIFAFISYKQHFLEKAVLLVAGAGPL
jgi:ATP-binding cassette, subfamily B, bacterial CvaB/MchF/RaxB